MAKKLGDKLIVIVNSDYQAGLKKGTSFMPEDDRLEIENIHGEGFRLKEKK